MVKPVVENVGNEIALAPNRSSVYDSERQAMPSRGTVMHLSSMTYDRVTRIEIRTGIGMEFAEFESEISVFHLDRNNRPSGSWHTLTG